MHVVVTGANGFIGTNLCELLGRLQCSVTKIAHGDWTWPTAPVDVVVHLAAYGTRPEHVDVGPYLESSSFTEWVTRRARAAKAKLIVAGSVVETMPIASLYAASKSLSTQIALARGATVLRFTTPYGPHESPHRIVPRLIESGRNRELPPLSNPNFSRDFVYVGDVTKAIVQAIDMPAGTYTVGTGVQTTLRDVAAVAMVAFAIPTDPEWGGAAARPWEEVVPYVDPLIACPTSFSDGFRLTAGIA